MSTPINDGGPAFPRPAFTTELGNVSHDTLSEAGFTSTQQSGMSLRDWFAGQALVGYYTICGHIGEGIGSYDNAAILAYRQADAMLAEREVKP
jgi:hypothetical protein